MKSRPSRRIAAILALGCTLLPGQAAAHGVKGQEDGSAAAILLGRARTLEQRGRLDLAKQDWSQVLVADPNEAEALAGLVRASRAEGHTAEADRYLARLRAAHPDSPELARLQGGGSSQDNANTLTEAAKLARAGDPRGAMALYRRVYGMTPPPGAPALAYYETEAATEDGRPHAIAGLRALADRYPADTRYQVALGRVLVRNARTRAEGRTILEGLPQNQEAVAALRGSEAVPPGATGGARAATPATPATVAANGAGPKNSGKPAPGAEARVSDPKLAAAEPRAAAVTAQGRVSARPSEAVEAVPRAPAAHSVLVGAPAPGRHGANLAEEQAAFAALNEHRNGDAEQIFRTILSKDPRDPRALAGMGYVRESAGDLKSAVNFFEQAQESGDRSLALTRAIVNAQFELAVKQAGANRARGDLPGAETQYRAALRERPNDPEALEGLGNVLLQEWRFGDAVPVYDRLTRVRPMDPAAWRGLVVADASAGRGGAALAADAQAPPSARTPLAKDGAYQRALSVARDSQGTQVARVEPPAPRPVPPPPVPSTPVSPPPVPPVPVPQPPVPQPAPVAVPPAPPPRPVRPAPTTPPPASAAVAEGAAKPGNKDRPAPVPGNSQPAAAARTGAGAVPSPTQPREQPPAAAVVPPVTARAAEEPSEVEAVQQANLALMRGNNAEAATMFRGVAARRPERAEGWRGLVLALHRAGHDEEVAAELGRIPASARTVLDRDASFQVAAGEALVASNRPNEALRAFARAQDVFSSQRLQPPLELVMETARLLAARGDDENLYRELMYLGDRTDLNDTRRAEVQVIWTRWAVRRARALAVSGADARAIALLNAAATAFSGNPEVLHLVADGYAGIGRPREAVALYRTQDLTSVSAEVIEAAVSAATAGRDFRTAETWMRVGLQRFGGDPQMLNVAAELAQARGHEKRAVELSQQAKALAPAQNAGLVLAAELREAPAGQGWGRPMNSGGQLSVLLSPGEVGGSPSGKPYLPAIAGEPAPGVAAASPNQPPVLAAYDEPSE